MESTKQNGGGLLLLGFFLALGIIISSLVIAGTVKKVKLSNQTIKVKGFAEQKITSDMAVWRAKFTARGEDQVTTYYKLESDRAKILAYLAKNGIGRDEVDVFSVSTWIKYRKSEKGHTTNEIEGYVLNQSIAITSSNVKLIGRLSKESTSLIKEGMELSSYNPEYYYTKIDEIKVQLIGAATKDASLRAQQLAENSGSKVGALRSASQGVFQITPLYSTETSGYGVYDISTIEKSVKAVVTIEFSIGK